MKQISPKLDLTQLVNKTTLPWGEKIQTQTARETLGIFFKHMLSPLQGIKSGMPHCPGGDNSSSFFLFISFVVIQIPLSFTKGLFVCI